MARSFALWTETPATALPTRCVEMPSRVTSTSGNSGISYFRLQSRGTGMQTLSAELASAPQVKQATVGLSVMCAISSVKPWLFSIQICPVCLAPQLQVVVDPIRFTSCIESGYTVIHYYLITVTVVNNLNRSHQARH